MTWDVEVSDEFVAWFQGLTGPQREQMIPEAERILEQHLREI